MFAAVVAMTAMLAVVAAMLPAMFAAAVVAVVSAAIIAVIAAHMVTAAMLAAAGRFPAAAVPLPAFAAIITTRSHSV